MEEEDRYVISFWCEQLFLFSLSFEQTWREGVLHAVKRKIKKKKKGIILTIATPAFERATPAPAAAALLVNCEENPVTAEKIPASRIDPTHNFVRLPIQSLVAEPARAPAQLTMLLTKVSSSLRSVETIPSWVYMLGK